MLVPLCSWLIRKIGRMAKNSILDIYRFHKALDIRKNKKESTLYPQTQKRRIKGKKNTPYLQTQINFDFLPVLFLKKCRDMHVWVDVFLKKLFKNSSFLYFFMPLGIFNGYTLFLSHPSIP